MKKAESTIAPHTPGPWHVAAIKAGRIIGDETTEQAPEKLHISTANVMICTVYPSRLALYRRDARAIAELPAILAALRDCVASLEAAMEDPEADRDAMPPPALDRARLLLRRLDGAA